jgi:hypothetical protein
MTAIVASRYGVHSGGQPENRRKTIRQPDCPPENPPMRPSPAPVLQRRAARRGGRPPRCRGTPAGPLRTSVWPTRKSRRGGPGTSNLHQAYGLRFALGLPATLALAVAQHLHPAGASPGCSGSESETTPRLASTLTNRGSGAPPRHVPSELFLPILTQIVLRRPDYRRRSWWHFGCSLFRRWHAVTTRESQ